MTTETDLLPLPEWCQGCGESLPRDMQDYARANVEHAVAPLQAEIDALRTLLEDTVRDSTNKIEALRAEVVSERNLKADAIHACALANIHAELMAEALREATAMLLADYPETAKRLRAEADLLRGNRRKGSD